MPIIELLKDPKSLFLWFLALLIAITAHEFSHAWAAYKLGDSTAKNAGRMSLNPLVHLDPLGTLMIFLVRFGWGKPVPVNPNNFKDPRIGNAIVSIAGALANFFIASIFSIVYYFLGQEGTLFSNFLLIVIILNIILAVFNLIPIPPLDGSKVLYAFLPPTFNWRQFEIMGPFVIILLFFSGILSLILGPVVNFILRILGINLALF